MSQKTQLDLVQFVALEKNPREVELHDTAVETYRFEDEYEPLRSITSWRYRQYEQILIALRSIWQVDTVFALLTP